MKKTRISFLLAALFSLFACATLINPALAAMPLPTGPHYFEYAPVASPEASQDPAVAKPVGIGPLAQGGNTLRLQIGTAEFEGPVDIYFIIYAPFSSVIVMPGPVPAYPYNDPLSFFHVMQPDKTFEPLLFGFVPWKSNITSALNEDVFGNVPTFFLAQSTYTLYLLVTPAGSIDGYYLWSTSFSTYPPVCSDPRDCLPVPVL